MFSFHTFLLLFNSCLIHAQPKVKDFFLKTLIITYISNVLDRGKCILIECVLPLLPLCSAAPLPMTYYLYIWNILCVVWLGVFVYVHLVYPSELQNEVPDLVRGTAHWGYVCYISVHCEESDITQGEVSGWEHGVEKMSCGGVGGFVWGSKVSAVRRRHQDWVHQGDSVCNSRGVWQTDI